MGGFASLFQDLTICSEGDDGLCFKPAKEANRRSTKNCTVQALILISTFAACILH